jgi:hypothetical protein
MYFLKPLQNQNDSTKPGAMKNVKMPFVPEEKHWKI